MPLGRLSVSNWPFAIKFAVPALASILAIGFVIWDAQLNMQRQLKMISGVIDVDFVQMSTLSKVSTRIQKVNGSLYRLLTLQAAGNTEQNVGGLVEELGNTIDAIIADLQTLGALNSQHGTVQEEATRITEELEKFKGAIGFVASMLEIDFASAVSFVEPFEQSFSAIENDINEITGNTLVLARQSAENAASESSASIRILVFAGAGAALFSGLLAFAVGRMTQRSIQQIADATLRLADADQSVDIDALERGDELQAIVTSLHTFKARNANLTSLQDLQDVQDKAKEEQRAATLKLADDLENSVMAATEAVSLAVADLEESAHKMNEAARYTAEQAQGASSATGEATQNVDIAATATEQLNMSISEITSRTADTANVTRDASSKASQSTTTVNELSEGANKIGEIVGLIADIARKTNLLALNATIEAARAGPAGKGFAVVAGEVKALATQSASATEEISRQIDGMRHVTDRTVSVIEEVVSAITKIDEATTSITAAVEEQSAATKGIAQSVRSAADGARTASANIEGVSDSARSTGTTANQLLEVIAGLSNQSQLLTESVQEVVRTLRAA